MEKVDEWAGALIRGTGTSIRQGTAGGKGFEKMRDLMLQPMNAENVDAVSAIEQECFPVFWSKQSFLEELENPLACYLVAYCNDSPVGFIGSWIVFDECHIMNIAVLPRYRQKGVASTLLEKTIEEALEKGVVFFSLEVRESNEEAIGLYRKYGFDVNGRRKSYYIDTGEDALLMWRTENEAD